MIYVIQHFQKIRANKLLITNSIEQNNDNMPEYSREQELQENGQVKMQKHNKNLRGEAIIEDALEEIHEKDTGRLQNHSTDLPELSTVDEIHEKDTSKLSTDLSELSTEDEIHEKDTGRLQKYCSTDLPPQLSHIQQHGKASTVTETYEPQPSTTQGDSEPSFVLLPKKSKICTLFHLCIGKISDLMSNE